MKGHECYHCKQWIPDGVEHDCWTTTEYALTKDLSEDLREAWERLRDTVVEFGEQRIYASHHSIMFARKACYFFVRPQRNRLEVVFWLGRGVVATEIRKSQKTSKIKHAHVVHLVHRDQVERPLTDWLREAYGLEDVLAAAKAAPVDRTARKPASKQGVANKATAKKKRAPKPKPRRASKRKPKAKR